MIRFDSIHPVPILLNSLIIRSLVLQVYTTMGNNISGTVYPPACEMFFGSRPLKILLAGSGVVGDGGGGGGASTPSNVQTIWTDDRGNTFHIHADFRVPWMQDQGDAKNPLTNKRYPVGGATTFAGLSRRSQNNRLAHWNAAQALGLVEHDERYGLPPANNAATAAGTGQVAPAAAASSAAAAATPDVNAQILEVLREMREANTQQQGANQTLSVTTSNLAEQVNINNEAQTAANSNLAAQVNRNNEAQTALTQKVAAQVNRNNEVQTAANQETAKALKDVAGEVKGMAEEIHGLKATLSKVTIEVHNELEVNTENIGKVFGIVNDVVAVLETPKGPERKKRVDDLVAATKNLDLATPAGKPPVGGFNFAINEAATITRFPDVLSGAHCFGQKPDYPFEYDAPLKASFDENPDLTPYAFVSGGDMIFKDHDLPFKVVDEKSAFLPTVIVVFTEGVVPTLHGSLEWIEEGLSMQVVKPLRELGLEWVKREFDGRTIFVLVNTGDPIDDKTQKKLRLLLNTPEEVMKKSAEPDDSEGGTVLYHKVLRDKGEVQKDPQSGKVLYTTPDPIPLQFFDSSEEGLAGDIDDLINDGVIEEDDREAVLTMAKVGTPRTCRLDSTQMHNTVLSIPLPPPGFLPVDSLQAQPEPPRQDAARGSQGRPVRDAQGCLRRRQGHKQR